MTKAGEPASIFNDVLGPVMIGPSSSHTAAAVRIGRMLRDLLGGEPRSVRFDFPRYSALAATHQGHGSDMGLAAGLLGMEADDPRMTDALDMATRQGLELSFVISDIKAVHPNTYQATARNREGERLSALFISSGGGMVELRELQGFALNIHGGYYETLLLLPECSAEAAQELRRQAEISTGLPVLLHENMAQQFLLEISSSAAPEAELTARLPGKRFSIKPVLPTLSRPVYPVLLNSAAALQQRAEQQGLRLSQLAVEYEAARGDSQPQAVEAQMHALVRIWRRTLDKMSREKVEYQDRILGPQAHLLPANTRYANATTSAVIRYTTLMMEAKSAMQVIVAAPTAGACGVLPGVVFALAEQIGASEDDIIRAMLAAGMLGVLIAERATFAGESGGCQAECGSASGMAAAAAVELLGGSAKQALDGAALALQNVLGLACDPVGGRVEVPCLGKNIMCACNALAMSELALAGFQVVIPLNETLNAMAEVGELLPDAICCTGGAGLSVQDSARAIDRRMN